jgi:hypothetical protein
MARFDKAYNEIVAANIQGDKKGGLDKLRKLYTDYRLSDLVDQLMRIYGTSQERPNLIQIIKQLVSNTIDEDLRKVYTEFTRLSDKNPYLFTRSSFAKAKKKYGETGLEDFAWLQEKVLEADPEASPDDISKIKAFKDALKDPKFKPTVRSKAPKKSFGQTGQTADFYTRILDKIIELINDVALRHKGLDYKQLAEEISTNEYDTLLEIADLFDLMLDGPNNVKDLIARVKTDEQYKLYGDQVHATFERLLKTYIKEVVNAKPEKQNDDSAITEILDQLQSLWINDSMSADDIVNAVYDDPPKLSEIMDLMERVWTKNKSILSIKTVLTDPKFSKYDEKVRTAFTTMFRTHERTVQNEKTQAKYQKKAPSSDRNTKAIEALKKMRGEKGLVKSIEKVLQSYVNSRNPTDLILNRELVKLFTSQVIDEEVAGVNQMYQSFVKNGTVSEAEFGNALERYGETALRLILSVLDVVFDDLPPNNDFKINHQLFDAQLTSLLDANSNDGAKRGEDSVPDKKPSPRKKKQTAVTNTSLYKSFIAGDDEKWGKYLKVLLNRVGPQRITSHLTDIENHILATMPEDDARQTLISKIKQTRENLPKPDQIEALPENLTDTILYDALISAGKSDDWNQTIEDIVLKTAQTYGAVNTRKLIQRLGTAYVKSKKAQQYKPEARQEFSRRLVEMGRALDGIISSRIKFFQTQLKELLDRLSYNFTDSSLFLLKRYERQLSDIEQGLTKDESKQYAQQLNIIKTYMKTLQTLEKVSQLGEANVDTSPLQGTSMFEQVKALHAEKGLERARITADKITQDSRLRRNQGYYVSPSQTAQIEIEKKKAQRIADSIAMPPPPPRSGRRKTPPKAVANTFQQSFAPDEQDFNPIPETYDREYREGLEPLGSINDWNIDEDFT